MLQRVGRSRAGCNRFRERFLIEFAASPWDVRVVDLVGNSEIVERGELSPPDAVREIAPVDQILLAESQKIPAVGPLGRSGQTKEKLSTEEADEATIGSGSCMMELVDDQIVKFVGPESV